MRRALLPLTCLMLMAASLAAQQMPGASQMAGVPLPDGTLPAGTVSVRVVREQMGNNVTNHPVTLKAPDRSLEAKTDAQGRATFADVPAGTPVTIETVVDGETLRSQEFPVPAAGGVRVALVAGAAAAAERERVAQEEAAKQPARPGVVVFGGESRVILEFQDDDLQVFYLLDIVNNARTPIAIGEPLVIELPEGASGAGALEGSSTLAQVAGDRIRINGPFPPGVTSVQVGYRLAYRGDSTTLTQQWPAAFEQVFVAAEKVGNLQMQSPQFEQQQDASAGGTPFLMATGGRINAGDRLTLTLSGLPNRSTLVRDVGIGLGLVILVAGMWAGIAAGRAQHDHRAALTKQKEKLFAELMTLEEQHRQGKVDERRYVSRRQSLVSQLERVMGELDGQGVAA